MTVETGLSVPAPTNRTPSYSKQPGGLAEALKCLELTGLVHFCGK